MQYGKTILLWCLLLFVTPGLPGCQDAEEQPPAPKPETVEPGLETMNRLLNDMWNCAEQIRRDLIAGGKANPDSVKKLEKLGSKVKTLKYEIARNLPLVMGKSCEFWYLELRFLDDLLDLIEQMRNRSMILVPKGSRPWEQWVEDLLRLINTLKLEKEFVEQSLPVGDPGTAEIQRLFKYMNKCLDDLIEDVENGFVLPDTVDIWFVEFRKAKEDAMRLFPTSMGANFLHIYRMLKLVDDSVPSWWSLKVLIYENNPWRERRTIEDLLERLKNAKESKEFLEAQLGE